MGDYRPPIPQIKVRDTFVRHYFDYNATTPIHPEIEKTIKKTLRLWGNPSSLHHEGRLAFAALATAREQAAYAIGALPEDIVFTSSGSEANTWLIYRLYREAVRTEIPVHIVLSAVEHPCLLRACEAYAGRWLSFDLVPVDAFGRVSVADVVAFCTDNTRLVSVMLANNELGTLQPVADIAKALHGRPIWVHTDATQAPGKLPIAVNHLGVDFLTLSAHKVYAPKGTGLLYMRPGVGMSPMIYGGGQEGRMRAGTENTLGIVAFGHALQLASASRSEWVADCVSVGDILSKTLEISGAAMNSPVEGCLPNTLNLRFEGVSGAALAMRLDLAGVAVSTGAACSTGAIEPSHVLLAIGQSAAVAAEAIRLSWGWGTTPAQAQAVCEILREAVAGIRGC